MEAIHREEVGINERTISMSVGIEDANGANEGLNRALSIGAGVKSRI
jgi:O-acetylhomoserine/O-acetylserine sulfhydrylase-like pyridoxal-dependent enzyme